MSRSSKRVLDLSWLRGFATRQRSRRDTYARSRGPPCQVKVPLMVHLCCDVVPSMEQWKLVLSLVASVSSMLIRQFAVASMLEL